MPTKTCHWRRFDHILAISLYKYVWSQIVFFWVPLGLAIPSPASHPSFPGVFSSFISSITSTVSSLRTYRQEQAKKQAQLLRFFNERNLSIDLYGRVQEIVRKQGLFEVRLNEQEVTLFKGVPERLLILMHEEMHLPALRLGVSKVFGRQFFLRERELLNFGLFWFGIQKNTSF